MHAAPDKNHFELFGLPVAFAVDVDDLTARYRELQRRIHPDKFANASDHERRLSLQMTALVNEAYQTLKQPVRRARYLLSLHGVDVGSETDTAMNPAFLAEQMEWREELEAIEAATDRNRRLAEMANRVARRLDEKTQEFARTIGHENLRGRELVREMQFLERLQEEIDDLGGG